MEIMMTDDTNFACIDTACTVAHCPECGACDFDVDAIDDGCNIILCPANFS